MRQRQRERSVRKTRRTATRSQPPLRDVASCIPTGPTGLSRRRFGTGASLSVSSSPPRARTGELLEALVHELALQDAVLDDVPEGKPGDREGEQHDGHPEEHGGPQQEAQQHEDGEDERGRGEELRGHAHVVAHRLGVKRHQVLDLPDGALLPGRVGQVERLVVHQRGAERAHRHAQHEGSLQARRGGSSLRDQPRRSLHEPPAISFELLTVLILKG